ncbi:MAG: NADH-quinone oxidoreductase subunit J [Halobacteriaceae archaeon]
MSSDRRDSKLPGLAAIGLFLVLALVFIDAGFQATAQSGFEAGVSITAGLGYLLFDLVGQTPLGSEGFLAVFEIIDVVLVAALVGAVMLARREHQKMTDGGTDQSTRGDQ